MRITRTDISMVRGDSEYILVTCTDSEGLPRPFVDGDTVYFTVKEATTKDTKILQKIVTVFEEDGTALIEIAPEDTKELKYREYVYDVQLTETTGRITTIVRPSKFVIEGEVTYE